MLNIAKDKMKKEEKDGLINFYLWSIDSLPIGNNTADAVIVNQVLHHLPDNSVCGWGNHKKVLKEFLRVLKSEGILIINSCSPEQIECRFWFYNLIPDAMYKMKLKVISLSELSNLLKPAEFQTPFMK